MLASMFLAAVMGVAMAVLYLRLLRVAPLVKAAAPPRDERPRIPAPALRQVVIDLLRQLGLDIVEEELRGGERRLVAVRDGKPEAGRCVVFVEPAPPGDRLPRPLLDELADSVRAEFGTVGLLVMPCSIAPAERPQLDVAVELVDGRKLRQLVAAYLPERLAELDRYRGFGTATCAAVV
jgi:hypothetical protein